MGRRGRWYPRRNPIPIHKRRPPEIDFHVFEHTYGSDKAKDLRVAKSQLLAILFRHVTKDSEALRLEYIGCTHDERLERALSRNWYRSKTFTRMKLVGAPPQLWYRALEALIADGYATESSEYYSKEVYFITLTSKGFDKFRTWYDAHQQKKEAENQA